MIAWPVTLVNEAAHRRCIFFLGAGVSASSVAADGSRPKTWGQFLDAALNLVHHAGNRDTIQSLVRERKYLLALEAIAVEADAGDYQQFLNENFNQPNFLPSDLHRVILDLDSRIVITTNFDKIYERLCLQSSAEGYKVLPYTSVSLADEIRSDTRLIIKAHGSIDEIGSMVFTRSAYHKAKARYAQFYELLKAIFHTHTCVFMGCSLDDPDVLLLLEDVKITASPNRPHYVLALQGSQSQYAKKDWLDSYNVKALEYEPDHAALLTELKLFRDQVLAKRAALGLS